MVGLLRHGAVVYACSAAIQRYRYSILLLLTVRLPDGTKDTFGAYPGCPSCGEPLDVQGDTCHNSGCREYYVSGELIKMWDPLVVEEEDGSLTVRNRGRRGDVRG